MKSFNKFRCLNDVVHSVRSVPPFYSVIFIMPLSHCVAVLSLASLVSLMTGCGDNLSSLQGQVTIDGRPAPAGLSLEFSPVAAGGSQSYASTNASGEYEASFTFREKGILPGEHIVHLVPGGGPVGDESMPVIGPNGKPVPQNDKPSAPELPEHYYQEILRITVQPGANQIDIPLSSDAKKDTQ